MTTPPSNGSSPSPPSEALSVTPPPPSFKGRLELGNFMFAGSGAEGEASPAGLRRSPRLSTPLRPALASLSPAPNPSSPRPSPSPLKRKAIADDDDSTTTQSPRGALRALQGSKSRTKSSPSSHAPPSKYAHLPLLPDAITSHLLVLMIGLNPGVETARSQHAYAHPSTLFHPLYPYPKIPY
jgi:TDG/mug DNA glycosylase family protein